MVNIAPQSLVFSGKKLNSMLGEITCFQQEYGIVTLRSEAVKVTENV